MSTKGGLYWSQSEKLSEIKPPLVDSDFVIRYYAVDRKKQVTIFFS